MKQGPPLAPSEQYIIKKLKKEGMAQKDIASTIKRPPLLVSTYLKSPASYGKRKPTGRPPKVDERAKRLILREAKKGKKSAAEIKADLKVPVTVRQVKRIISSCPDLAYKKAVHTPELTPKHKKDCVYFARNFLQTPSLWNSVIYSDEKRFNLDGPDGLHYYWSDLRKEPQFYSTRQQGGGSVMIWAAFSAKGTTEVSFIDRNVTSLVYLQILETHLLPYAAKHFPDGFTFQHDNASSHTSKVTKAWLLENKIPTLQWPARSPDLNPIENLWGIVARGVYENGQRQFNNTNNLKKAILDAWTAISNDKLKDLINSMTKWCMDVLENKGGRVNY